MSNTGNTKRSRDDEKSTIDGDSIQRCLMSIRKNISVTGGGNNILPDIIVLGAQSSGKSSIIKQSIFSTGVQTDDLFEVSQDTGTRTLVQILVHGGEQTTNFQVVLPCGKISDLSSPEQVKASIRKYWATLGKTVNLSEKISINIKKDNCPPVYLVDTPGYNASIDVAGKSKKLSGDEWFRAILNDRERPLAILVVNGKDNNSNLAAGQGLNSMISACENHKNVTAGQQVIVAITHIEELLDESKSDQFAMMIDSLAQCETVVKKIQIHWAFVCPLGEGKDSDMTKAFSLAYRRYIERASTDAEAAEKRLETIAVGQGRLRDLIENITLSYLQPEALNDELERRRIEISQLDNKIKISSAVTNHSTAYVILAQRLTGSRKIDSLLRTSNDIMAHCKSTWVKSVSREEEETVVYEHLNVTSFNEIHTQFGGYQQCIQQLETGVKALLLQDTAIAKNIREGVIDFIKAEAKVAFKDAPAFQRIFLKLLASESIQMVANDYLRQIIPLYLGITRLNLQMTFKKVPLSHQKTMGASTNWVAGHEDEGILFSKTAELQEDLEKYNSAWFSGTLEMVQGALQEKLGQNTTRESEEFDIGNLKKQLDASMQIKDSIEECISHIQEIRSYAERTRKSQNTGLFAWFLYGQN